MKNILNIKGILLDFGGTVDTNGVHWAEALWTAYAHADIPVEQPVFREAYKHGERTLALQPIIRPEYNFHDVLIAKTNIQLLYLTEAGYLPSSFDVSANAGHIAHDCYALVCQTVEKAKPVLEHLSQICPIVLVSNFYGNIRAVLEDLNISKYFYDIVESAVVGVRKPDPAIFALGVQSLGFDPANVVAIGDSYTKDIIPAKEIGCQTVWLKGQAWEETSDTSKADVIIHSFDELESLTK